LKFIKKGIHINQQHLPEPIVSQPLQELIKIMIEGLKMKKKIILGIGSLFFLLSIVGCTTLPIEFTPSPVKTELSYPEIGAETTCNVGDSLVSQGEEISGQGIVLSKDYVSGAVIIGQGQYILKGKLPDYLIFEPIDASVTCQGKTVEGRPCLALNTLTKELRFSYINAGSVYIGSLNPIISVDYFKIEPVSIKLKNDFQQTLIYMGKEGNKIKISYREFSNDLARPAFTTDISYDLNESHDIAYKNAQITIISATSANITYKVLHNFN
jgi:hypothetical protein